MTFKHIKNPDPISKEERYEMAMEEWNHIYGSSNLKKPTRDITQEEVNNALDKVASEILNPANKCGLSINGKCTGNFSPLDCENNWMIISEEELIGHI